jgi:hypothetical protein
MNSRDRGKDASDWRDCHRRFWEESFDRLDDELHRMRKKDPPEKSEHFGLPGLKEKENNGAGKK